MATFSERMGLRETRTLIQSTDLDADTRTALWNVLVGLQHGLADAPRYSANEQRNQALQQKLLRTTWTEHMRRPLDDMPPTSRMWNEVRSEILGGQWHDALELLELFAKVFAKEDQELNRDLASTFTEIVNTRFETYLVGYRFIGNEVAPIDSSAQAEVVTAALSDAASVQGALYSLERAIELLSSRESPDYPNSVKEAISAIEAITKTVTGKTTLSDGLKKLESSGLTIHPALKDGWLKLYGWASDESGVRHGGVKAADVDQTLAKYMLVSSSAFISYLVEEGRKARLL